MSVHALVVTGAHVGDVLEMPSESVWLNLPRTKSSIPVWDESVGPASRMDIAEHHQLKTFALYEPLPQGLDLRQGYYYILAHEPIRPDRVVHLLIRCEDERIYRPLRWMS